ASIGAVLDRISDKHRALVIDVSAVPFLDSTGANTLEGLARKAKRRGVTILCTGTSHDIRRTLVAQGLVPPLVTYKPSIEAAIEAVHPEQQAEQMAPAVF